MVEKKQKSKARRERCPTGTRWNEDKKKCVPVKKKKEEAVDTEENDEDEE